MCGCDRLFCLLIFTVVSFVIGERNATNNAHSANQLLNVSSPTLRNYFNNEGNQACVCVMSDVCSDVKAIKNDTHCEEPQICCKIDSPSLLLSPVQEASGSLVLSESIPLASSTSTTKPSVGNPALTKSSINEQSVHSSISPSSRSSAECGIRKRTNQILVSEENSNPALFGEFPWMVAIFKTNESSPNGTLLCSGSLLSPHIILTAAHCVHNIEPNKIQIRAGEFIINNQTDTPERLAHQDRAVDTIIKHVNYSSKVLYNDLALIRVTEPFNYEDHIAPICSPITDTSYLTASSIDSQNCLVTGWTRNAGDVVQNKLRKVSTTLMTKENCENKLRETRLGSSFKLHSSFLCATEDDSVCLGNGRGPLVCASRSNPNKYVLIGVMSWGIGCDINIPAVYASVENNIEWLMTEFNNLNTVK